MSNRSHQRRVPAGVRRDSLPDAVDRGKRQVAVVADLVKQDRREEWGIERQLSGDLVDEDFLWVLPLYAGLPK
jgi:hypothetical protein